MHKPLLRADIQPVTTMIEGRRKITFHDPYQLTDERIAIDMQLLPVLQILDGRHDLRDIQMILMKEQGGRIVYISEVESLIERLDHACLLNSEFFHHKMNILRADFMNQKNRFPAYAGKSYMSEPEQLIQFIQNVENNLKPLNSENTEDSITGILAPHIDIKIAGETYVNTYRRLKGKHYDLVIVLGINHQSQNGLFSVSDKVYVTPFGDIETDRAFISDLKRNVPEGALSPDDFGHKIEHSIEFQTIFLRYYLTAPFVIVPILCGSVHEFIFKKENLFSDARFQGMVQTLNMLIQERKGRILIVAGVDLSHVGLKFGDSLPAESILTQARSNDRTILAFLTSDEPEKILQHSIETRDQYHVCGLPAILLFASLLRKNRADIIHFETYDERETQSAVNYASVIFTESL
ncbi:MAG: AmmeMemoRadiSam system protein B [Deltaproteobacteria bacterium]|nr:AmmeMemoRadiSam system protein B [Deltaproteobacteria bacterium]